MRHNIDLRVGTRVINAKTGKLGRIASPHKLIGFSQRYVRYDDSPDPEIVEYEDIEHEGSPAFAAAMERFHKPHAA